MLVEFGSLALSAALAIAVFLAFFTAIGVFFEDRRLIGSAVPLTYLLFVLILVSFVVLVHAYIVSDFSVLNVVENSHSEKPLLYKITGVWGNHEGSMLLWVLIVSFFSTLVGFFGRELPARLKALILGCQAWVTSAFLLFILFTSNPFQRVDPPALQGNDLNPILQDIGLAIHPPLLYLGYVGFSVCFSFAIAALIDGRVDAAWARWVRPWTLVSWLFLTGGIMVGSYWAYYELGWGGYWFWDPVENASLMPWLAGTALLHSAIVLEKRGALKIWTLFLAILTFSLSLMGTFLVRSGILTSVHSFAVDPLRGRAILAILFFFIGAALFLFALRASSLKTGGFFRPMSREGLLVFNNLFLTTATATVFVGTLYPLLLETLTGQKISVGAPFFNLTFGPLMIPLLILVSFGPMIAWKRGDFFAVAEKLWFAFGLAFIMIGVVLYKTYLREILAALGIGLATFVFFGGITDLWYKSGLGSTSLRVRFKRLCGLPRSAYGTALAHMGLGVTLFGIIAVATFGQERILIMQTGDKIEIAERLVTLKGARNVNGPNYTETQFEFGIENGQRKVGDVMAAKRFYPSQKMPTTEAGIQSRGLSQLYIAPGDITDQGLILHIWWKPYVICIWLGAIMMMLGGCMSLSDRRQRVGAPRREKSQHEKTLKSMHNHEKTLSNKKSFAHTVP
ncbi:heme lyase CcmF/NrfE family subunit [Bartonella tamiae]|uniref:Cytochrome c-type biogenesis protein CcmF n=1 Tax=Bartonella tamiae Th239 TaxID=1094558 RepID=J0R4J5_9HYPH|nr:heme lyase CcmF/NrfE family subunit [Bartonella tamiae]EJF90584.1 cytochrome c-type biogenesis protein CcmF [Bartonella tamiae Th239]EJF94038.1 cytochrome c-type biogenesis protein CcmF [Bartonella tamiae Th307]